MYGLKKAAILAYDQLVKHLKTRSFYPVIGTNAIFCHYILKTKLCLCVHDFGIKYHSRDDAENILNALKYKYAITTDWEGNNFCGLTFDWNYKAGYVDTEIPDYVPNELNTTLIIYTPSHRF